MPLTPRYAVICYDNQIYTAPDLVDGRLVVKRDEDANAINEFQYLKAAENMGILCQHSCDRTELQ
jgi:hypothetical protein